MTLAMLLQSLEGSSSMIDCMGNLNVKVEDITDDSRAVKPGTVFVAVRGTQVDGHRYIDQAVQAGAAAVVGEETSLTDSLIPFIHVRDSRRSLGILADSLYGHPSLNLRTIGVTGTNGKTTVTYLCKAILESAGRHVGLLGTVSYHIGEERIAASHTTPGAVEFHRLLSRMVNAGLDSVVMEVSSHALALDRTAGCEFDTAVFTNLTQDHLDFHGTFDAYFDAKQKLFSDLWTTGKKPGSKRAIINIDDPWGQRVRDATRAPVWTYSIREPSDLRAEHVQLALDGTRFVAVTPCGSIDITTPLIGEHNVYNILSAIGVGLQEELGLDVIREGLRSITNIPGRFEPVNEGQDFFVIVDYAHTDDALDRVLSAAETMRTGRILTVFGCGGDRDRGKRPKMGRIAAEKSDLVYLTSDNPRTEDPLQIIRDVEVGLKERQREQPRTEFTYEVIPDRRQAIGAAIREARAGDMVLIAGKGHEDYQIIGTERHHFDDREVARAALKKVLL